MKRLNPFFKKLITLFPLSSTLLLAILVKTGLTQIDPNIVVKATPK